MTKQVKFTSSASGKALEKGENQGDQGEKQTDNLKFLKHDVQQLKIKDLTLKINQIKEPKLTLKELKKQERQKKIRKRIRYLCKHLYDNNNSK